MKSLSLAILLFSFAALASAQGVVVSMQGSGNFAVTNVNANGAFISLIASNGTDANGNPITVLSYQINTTNPDGTTTENSGFGVIPNGACFSGNQQHELVRGYQPSRRLHQRNLHFIQLWFHLLFQPGGPYTSGLDQ